MLVDITFMLKGFYDLKYLLINMCEITNFMLAIPIKLRIAQAIAETLVHRSICTFGPSRLIIMDKGSAFTREFFISFFQPPGVN